MKISELRKLIREEVAKATNETYYNPEWMLTNVQDWIETYAMNKRLNFKLVHKTNKKSTIGPHAKENTYYVYDVGTNCGIVIRNEKVKGAPRLDNLYVYLGAKGSGVGSLVSATTLTDASENDVHDAMDKKIK